MTNEQLEKAINFLLENQAQTSINVDKLTTNIDKVSRVLKMAVVAGRRVRSDFRKSQDDIQALIENGKEQNEKLNILISTQMQSAEAIRELKETAQQSTEAIKELRETAQQNTEAIKLLAQIVSSRGNGIGGSKSD